MKNTSIIYHAASVTRERRNQLNNHKSVVIWFTGLSGSGKSTLAHSVEEILFNKYIDNAVRQQHVYNKKNLLNDWFVVKSGR